MEHFGALIGTILVLQPYQSALPRKRTSPNPDHHSMH